MKNQIKVVSTEMIPESCTDPLILKSSYSVAICYLATKLEHGRYIDIGFATIKSTTCLLMKSGHPNDEALSGHPLYSRGFEGVALYEIENSTTIEDLELLNRVNFPHTSYRDFKHYILSFKDSTLEFVCKQFSVEITNDPYSKISLELLGWINDQP